MRDPSLPVEIATRVQAIVGLSNLAVAATELEPIAEVNLRLLAYANSRNARNGQGRQGNGRRRRRPDGVQPSSYSECMAEHAPRATARRPASIRLRRRGRAWTAPARRSASSRSTPSRLSDVQRLSSLRSGCPRARSPTSPGSRQWRREPRRRTRSEVLLDIDTILLHRAGRARSSCTTRRSPAARQLPGRVQRHDQRRRDVISNSWAYCEDQTTLADVQSIDTILQTAAASGISVFTGSGDHGSTCLDGNAEHGRTCRRIRRTSRRSAEHR